MGWFKSKAKREAERVTEEQRRLSDEKREAGIRKGKAIDHCMIIAQELGKQTYNDILYFDYRDDRIAIETSPGGCKIWDVRHSVLAVDYRESDSGTVTISTYREGSWMDYVAELAIKAEQVREERRLEKERAAREAAELAFKPID